MAAVAPRNKYHRLHELYDLMQKGIDQVADELRQEMDLADIQFAVPLVMDLGRAAFDQNPGMPFTFQIKLVSDISLKHFGAIMPFVMVDPRRSRAADLLIRCLGQRGFLGVKMYPALGYHPNPDSFFNEPQTCDELDKMCAYCQANSVPITTHCSPGGAHSGDILRVKSVRAELTQPTAWAGVLKKYPRLHLNLAHFGQDMILIEDPTSWAFTIRDLMRKYPGVYTDLAYNKHALMPKTSHQYFKALNNLLDSDPIVGNRVLFGTDWAMTRQTWR
jgi:predicted TIM-barrel fold metal-dependent hydrolase